MDDPCRPSLDAITGAGHAFSIPWGHRVCALMTSFDSSRMSHPDGPWVKPSPFDLASLGMTTIIPDTGGGIASFQDGLSTNLGSSSDHLSASLGLTVGYPFLNASVTGQYDSTVMENENVRNPSTCALNLYFGSSLR